MLYQLLSAISDEQLPLVGGKAASLVMMLRQNLPVPDGFVVFTDDHLDAGSVMPGLDHLGGERFAVRSSAGCEDGSKASWAGQFETYLNVPRAEVLRRIDDCRASAGGERAVAYAAEHGVDPGDIRMSVLVQKMVDSEAAGVAFSAHPVTQRRDEMVIEGARGLGDKVVSGEVTPDRFVVRGGEIVERMVSDVAALGDDQVLELTDLVRRIEKFYGFPVDVEWAFADGQFFVLQSRPITTLSDEPVRTFTKLYTREHELFFADAWRKSNLEDMRERWNLRVDNVLFIHQPGSLLTSTWYDLSEPFPTYIFDNLFRDERYFDRLVSVYEENWAVLKPYLDEVKGIDDQEGLVAYLDAWVKWWSPMATLLMIPDIEGVPERMKAKATQLRDRDQEYSDSGTEPVMAYMRSRYFGVSDVFSLLLVDEMVRFGELNEKELDDIRDRKDGVALFNDQLVSLRDLDEALREARFALRKADSDGDVRGTCAHPGVVRGKVRVIMLKSEIDRLEAGEILVTPMTSPDFVRAMDRCAAIVTDEGGITCHAAIVAREIGKPCVIGTQNATEVLKTGDAVEVDAINGAVRRVE